MILQKNKMFCEGSGRWSAILLLSLVAVGCVNDQPQEQADDKSKETPKVQNSSPSSSSSAQEPASLSQTKSK